MSISIEIISRNKAPSSHWKFIIGFLVAVLIGYTSASLMGHEEPVIEEIQDWPSIAFGD